MVNAKSRRRGAVVPLVAVCLTILMGMLGFALEGGMMMERRRQAQAAADAAALAGASHLFQRYNYRSVVGENLNEGVRTTATTTAVANGFTHDGGDNLITVRVSSSAAKEAPLLYTGAGGHVQNSLSATTTTITGGSDNGKLKTNYVEVTIQFKMTRSFSNVFGGEAVLMSARAVASAPLTKPGVLMLDPSVEFAAKFGGPNPFTILSDASFITNTTHANAVQHSNTSKSVTAPEWNFNSSPGGPGTLDGPKNTNTPPTPDPFRNLAVPTPVAVAGATLSAIDVSSGSHTFPPGKYDKLKVGGDANVTLTPGDYQFVNGIEHSGTGTVTMGAGNYYIQKEGIKVSADGTLNMGAGIYYIEGKGINYSGNGTVSGTEVMIYNTGTPSNPIDQINISGNGTFNITAPTTGIYAGISIFQERTSTLQINISGNGPTTIGGTFYAPNAKFHSSGNGTVSVGQIVSRTMEVSGDANFTITSNGPPPAKKLFLVE